MDDLIDRQSLYEAFQSIDWWGRNRHEVLTHGAHDESDAFITYKDAVKAIDDAPAVKPKKVEWIEIMKNQPNPFDGVLTFNARNQDGGIRIMKGFSAIRIATHWMPLPEPPKEVE